MPRPFAAPAARCLLVGDNACEFRRRGHLFQVIVGGTEGSEMMDDEGWTMNDHEWLLFFEEWQEKQKSTSGKNTKKGFLSLLPLLPFLLFLLPFDT